MTPAAASKTCHEVGAPLLEDVWYPKTELALF
jgi:hypothetical protein